jgi:hypothetical protein
MLAIQTKYCEPTNTRGSRIKALTQVAEELGLQSHHSFII